MSDYGELRLPPVVTHVNKQTGRYMKGHVPANKGKKWSEWMSKRGARRSAKGARRALTMGALSKTPWR